MLNKKILFLLPPSEGKNKNPHPSPLLKEREYKEERLNFHFEKPQNIAENVTEKDLKCTGKRFEEGLELNKKLTSPHPSPKGEGAFIEAISRYSGVMFNAINYENMSETGKSFFEENFLILSGMYGIVKPLDIIGNYKLPIESSGLLDFWGTKVLEEINKLNPDFVVNLLPISYSKLIFGKNKKQEIKFNEIRKFKIMNINFVKEKPHPLLSKKSGQYIKISHGVKKIKGEWIKNICENNQKFLETISTEDFGNSNIKEINIK